MADFTAPVLRRQGELPGTPIVVLGMSRGSEAAMLTAIGDTGVNG